MDKKFHQQCFRIARYFFGVIASAILFYLISTNIVGVWNSTKAFFGIFGTIILAFSLAYVLNAPVSFFKKHFSKIIKKEKTALRLSVTVTYIIMALALTVFVWQLIPALIENIGFFADNLNSYLNGFESYIEKISKNIYFGQTLLALFNDAVTETAAFITNWFSVNFMEIMGMLYKTTDIVLGFIVALAVSVYMLLSRDTLKGQTKKVLISVFPRNVCDKIMSAAYAVNDSFSGYMSGVFVSSLIIGILCWICMAIFGLHYAPLISFIVMITDIIPYFGPFIGAAIGAILLLLVEPWDALWFLVIILSLQQITSNFINPGIIGKVTGLDSVYVILSIIVMGGLFGVVGMIVGVPIFVIIFKALRRFISSRAKENVDEKTTE